MVRGDLKRGIDIAKKYGIPYMGYIPYIDDLDNRISGQCIETVLSDIFGEYVLKILNGIYRYY